MSDTLPAPFITGIRPQGGFRLRDGQSQFLSAWAGALARGERNALGVFVPGYGKTITALASYLVAREMGIANRLVVFVPRGNLRDQYADAQELAFVFQSLGSTPPTYCVADSDRVFVKNLQTEFVVTTYQYAAGDRGNEALLEYCRQSKALFVFDEVHHLADEGTWATRLARFPHAASVALSGTPLRSDNKTLFGVPFDEDADGVQTYRALHEVTMRDAHEEGRILKRVDAHVVDYSVRMVNTESGEEVDVTLSELRQEVEASRDVDTYLARRKLRFHEVYLDALVGPAVARFQEKRGELVRALAKSGSLLDGWRDHQMLVIAMSNAHSAAILDYVKRRFPGLRAERIGQDVPLAERTKHLNDYREGRLDVMVQVDMIGEGTDIKPISVIVKADLVRALSKTLQQVFRGMRYVPSWPEEANRCDLYAADDSDVVETLRWLASEEKVGIKMRKESNRIVEPAAIPDQPERSAWALKSVRDAGRQTHRQEQFGRARSSRTFHADAPAPEAAPVQFDVAKKERELRLACSEIAKELAFGIDVPVSHVHAAWKRQIRGQAQADASVVALEKKKTWLERCLRMGRLV
ncbi:DEAD/DEAH box helicase [Rubricoccus marinus]|uniref:DEAD/DEAH box helicase n=1 Tax=Rubricoccus marinus TaxID=716817 RepID=UPI001C52C8C7|nr:DEAD/DEAH box helicase family protein [Rubricoccus marinus]